MTTKVYLDHQPRKIAIIGMGPSIIDYMPKCLTQEWSPDLYDEVWAVNMAANFVVHDLVIWMDDLKSQQEFRPNLLRGLVKRGMPVLTSKAYPDIVPASFDFPLSEVSQISMPFFAKPYLNNGVAMAIAYAIFKNVMTIDIYGADFTYPGRDYAESGRACVEAWIVIACSRGMNVGLPGRTSLLDTVKDGGIYGYAEQPEVQLPNGVKFQYARASEVDEATGSVIPVTEVPQYVAEDSSGQVGVLAASATIPGIILPPEVKDEIAGSVPRESGNGADHGRPDTESPGEVQPPHDEAHPAR